MVFKNIKKLFSFKRDESSLLGQESYEEVCVFPLPNVVLLPGVILPLHIFEKRYQEMTEHLVQTQHNLAMSWTERLANGQIKKHDICGAGKLNIMNSYADGRKDIFIEGQRRLKIIDILQKQPYIKAVAKNIADIPFKFQNEENSCLNEIQNLSKRWIFLTPDIPDELMNHVNSFKQPHHLADFITFYFSPSMNDKQKMLETIDRKERVLQVISMMENQITQLEKASSQQKLSRHKKTTTLH